MRKVRFLALGLLLLLLAPVQVSASEELLEFDSMIGVLGPTDVVRGLAGGGLPWIITEGKGELSSNGDLEVEVTGLVLARRAPVPPALQGTNPVNQFRVFVSCLTAGGTVSNVPAGNMEMEDVPAGNARLETQVTLPSPCNDPIVFVTSPAGAWFARSP